MPSQPPESLPSPRDPLSPCPVPRASGKGLAEGSSRRWRPVGQCQPASFVAPWAVAPARGSHSAEVGLGEPRRQGWVSAQEAGLGVPRPRTGHCVLMIFSPLPPQ